MHVWSLTLLKLIVCSDCFLSFFLCAFFYVSYIMLFWCFLWKHSAVRMLFDPNDSSISWISYFLFVIFCVSVFFFVFPHKNECMCCVCFLIYSLINSQKWNIKTTTSIIIKSTIYIKCIWKCFRNMLICLIIFLQCGVYKGVKRDCCFHCKWMLGSHYYIVLQCLKNKW